MWVLDSVDTFYVKSSTTKSSRNEVLKTALSHLLLKTSFKNYFIVNMIIIWNPNPPPQHITVLFLQNKSGDEDNLVENRK